MEKKVVGVLGGMGPQATVDFMDKVVKKTPATKDQDHIRMVVDNNPQVPDRTKAIIEGGDNPNTYLRDMAKRLENMGADFLVMPCNTAHYFYKDIQDVVNIPFVNMLECTARYINKLIGNDSKQGKVGLLATSGTLQTEIYQNQLSQFGFEVITPEPYQQLVMEAIYAVKAGDIGTSTRELLEKPIKQLENNGAKAIIMGCTEIPVIATTEQTTQAELIDPTEVLADETVSRALKTGDKLEIGKN
ncbi:aspartate/glutamate racemase family protein [Natranaerobius thermophilus]|uniref:Aspartate racemase n=1 Tax=Natranaerobius thermophilus (strain ATCC BAA-1301 / DSM 18059 / JW/NM-WN-LF) TaxID=457570 RepID=B2A6U3_NATTJ|nr:amino acid racemase [Natranaerobius thermophilus]ACB84224.1 aspartate racemase [Natranaerobius thermophilus JW/NM-WN-LF]